MIILLHFLLLIVILKCPAQNGLIYNICIQVFKIIFPLQILYNKFSTSPVQHQYSFQDTLSVRNHAIRM